MIKVYCDKCGKEINGNVYTADRRFLCFGM